MPEGVDNADRVEHAGDGGVEGADLVEVPEALDPARGIVNKPLRGLVGGGIVELEVSLVNEIDCEGDGPNCSLREEPPEVLFTIHDIDAADEDAPEEETEDADHNRDGSFFLPEVEVAGARKKECEDARRHLEGFACWRMVVGHAQACGGCLEGLKKVVSGSRETD